MMKFTIPDKIKKKWEWVGANLFSTTGSKKYSSIWTLIIDYHIKNL